MYTITLPLKYDKKRIDSIFADVYNTYSKSQWNAYGTFYECINDTKKPIHKGYKARYNHTYEAHITLPELTITPTKHNIITYKEPYIIDEGEGWIAVYKPYGYLTHPSKSDNNAIHTVPHMVEWLSQYLIKTYKTDVIDMPPELMYRAGVVHRLDKDTSGVLIMAKNYRSLRYLQGHWMHTYKCYMALVNGVFIGNKRVQSGIMIDPYNAMRRLVVPLSTPHSKHSETLFYPLASYNDDTSLVLCKLKTGRTHQIRTHLKELKHGIINDMVYNKKSDISSHMQLYSVYLRFINPDTDMPYTIIYNPTNDIPEPYKHAFGDTISKQLHTLQCAE